MGNFTSIITMWAQYSTLPLGHASTRHFLKSAYAPAYFWSFIAAASMLVCGKTYPAPTGFYGANSELKVPTWLGFGGLGK
jgi:hypothetical protein